MAIKDLQFQTPAFSIPPLFALCLAATPLAMTERDVATHVVWWRNAVGGISGDGCCIFLTALPLCMGNCFPPTPLCEIQLELEISGQCWLPAHSHKPGSIGSISGASEQQEEKVRRRGWKAETDMGIVWECTRQTWNCRSRNSYLLLFLQALPDSFHKYEIRRKERFLSAQLKNC